MTYTLSGLPAAAAEPTVWIALSEAGGAYADAAAAIAGEIERAGAGRAEGVARPWRELSGAPPRLIVAVGSQALRGMLESGPRVPLLAVLVPATAWERLATQAGAGGREYGAVLLDQPVARQLAAVKLALPERRRIGMLFGPESRAQEAAFQRMATDAGLQLVPGRVDGADTLGGPLQRTLEDSDVLLAVPDPAIFNSTSLQNILTTAYRRRVPLVAFSPAYVKAGALFALYSTPAQLGRQAGEVARAFLGGRALPPAQAPREFTVGINAEVARSLGLPLRAEDAEGLAGQLRALERRP